MNVGGGEAADQMVRMMLSGTEVAVRLSGSALKNLLALSLALARNHKQLSGKVNLGTQTPDPMCAKTRRPLRGLGERYHSGSDGPGKAVFSFPGLKAVEVPGMCL